MPWSCTLAVRVFFLFLLLASSTLSLAQSGLDLTPSNPLSAAGSAGGLLRGSNAMNLSGHMLSELIPSNLEIGYLHTFGNRVACGRLTLDYVLPIDLHDTIFFGEAHSEFQDFWRTVRGAANNRVDVSVGGGCRRMFRNDVMVGVNAFCDTARVGGSWYASIGFGAEMAAVIAGHDALDLNFNWYGHPYNDLLPSVFRRGTGNYNVEAGYSHELYEKGPDLRLKVSGYRFGNPCGVYGLTAGAELRSRDGVLSLKYEGGRDDSTGTYHTIGGFVNIGLQLDNLLDGESPFVMPEPIFRSPRNLRKVIASKVKRTWSQAAVGKASGKARSEVCSPSDIVGSVSKSDGLVFVPWGCIFSSDEFQAFTRVVIGTFTVTKTGGEREDELNIYWGNNSTTANRFISKLTRSESGSNVAIPHDAALITPAATVSGMWLRARSDSPPDATWHVAFENIQIIP